MVNIYHRARTSLDGVIVNVATNDIGNAQRRYTYFDLAGDGYFYASIEHIITNTTLTLEACNISSGLDQRAIKAQTITSTASGTDVTGATLIDMTLNTVQGFVADDDLIGIKVRIVSDASNPTNVGAIRIVTDYAQATGTMTFNTALPAASTANVTQYILEDNNDDLWQRRVSDPTASQWRDVTEILTGASSHTTSGTWFFDTPLSIERFRINRLTTNASNSCVLRLSRG